MNFKLDENLHPENGELLRERGHDFATVHDQGLRGHEYQRRSPRFAARRDEFSCRLTWTSPTFRCSPPEHHAGLIVLRLRSKGRKAVRKVLEKVLNYLDAEPVTGRL